MYNLKLFINRLAIKNCLRKWRATLNDAEIYIGNNAKFHKHMARANNYADRYLKLAKKRDILINELELEAWSND